MDAKHDCCGRDNGFQSHAGGCPVQTEYERHYRDRAEVAESQVAALTASLASVTSEVERLKSEKDYDGKEVLAASLAEIRKRSDEMFKYIIALRHALVDHTCADGRSKSGEVNWGELLLRYGANASELASPPSPAPVESKPKSGESK